MGAIIGKWFSADRKVEMLNMMEVAQRQGVSMRQSCKSRMLWYISSNHLILTSLFMRDPNFTYRIATATSTRQLKIEEAGFA